MSKKPLTRRDSIEKLQQDKIKNLEKQSHYLQSLLTEALPKYQGGNYSNHEKVSENVIQAKRLYFADSPEKSPSKTIIRVQKEKQSPLKLKKQSPKKSQTSPLKGILKQTQTLKNKQREGKFPEKQKQRMNSQNYSQLHSYSILLKLQKFQSKLPESQKIVYKYRQIHDLKSYTEEEIDGMINELLNKSKISEGEENLSVTDQFILSRFFDLKVRQALQKKKENTNQSKNLKYKPSRSGEKQINSELLNAFEEIKFVWNFYELKLKHCPDLVRGNSKDERIYGEVKTLYLDLMNLEDQVRQQNQEDDSDVKDLREDKKKKVRCHPKKLTEDVVAKKIKGIMKRFKEIMIAN